MSDARQQPAAAAGRPRDRAVDRRIQDAACALLAEHGVSGLTVGAVASRAGVARTTVYRRHPGAASLLFAAIRHPPRTGPLPDHGSLEADLAAVVAAVAATLGRPGAAAAIGAIIAATVADPQARAEREIAIADERRWIGELLDRHRARLRRGVDADTVVDLLAGPVVYRLLLRGDPIGPADVRAIADAAARAVRRPD